MCDHCERELIMRRVRMTTSMHGARCACDRGTARSLCTLVRMLRGSAASPPEPAPLSGRQRVSTESAPDVTLTSVRLRFQPGSWVKIRRRDEGFWCEVVHGTGDELEVEVANDLIHNPDLPLGTRLRIRQAEVVDTFTGGDEAAFRELLRRVWEAAPAAPPTERWAVACAAAQLIWAQQARRATS